MTEQNKQEKKVAGIIVACCPFNNSLAIELSDRGIIDYQWPGRIGLSGYEIVGNTLHLQLFGEKISEFRNSHSLSVRNKICEIESECTKLENEMTKLCLSNGEDHAVSKQILEIRAIIRKNRGTIAKLQSENPTYSKIRTKTTCHVTMTSGQLYSSENITLLFILQGDKKPLAYREAIEEKIIEE